MKTRLVYGLILIFICAAAWAQQDNSQKSEEKKPTLKSEEDKKPTLGPAPAPSLYGPRTASIMDAGRLRRVQKIYIEQMDNNLSDKLLDDLGKIGRFKVVAERAQADAVLRGSCMDLRHLRVVHSEVFLNDRRTGASIWQDNIRQPFNPPTLEKAVTATADIIVRHLTESVQQAATH